MWLSNTKLLTKSTFTEDWADGPPDHVLGQVHATQLSASIPSSGGDRGPDHFWVRSASGSSGSRSNATQRSCDMIRDTTAAFVELLRRGELPEYDGSEPSYRAWWQRYAPADAVLDLSDDAEARWRAEAWHQARLDKADVDASIEAHKWFFSRVLDRAGDGYSRIKVASLPEDIKLSRIERKAYSVAASTALSWRFVRREK